MSRIGVFVVLMLCALPAAAVELTRVESLPPQPAGGTPTRLADLWTFYCPEGGSFRISVDTLAVNNATTSPLDPEYYLYVDSTYCVAAVFGGMSCTVPSACGAPPNCPWSELNCGPWGGFTLAVTTAVSSTPGCGDADGYYLLRVEVFDGPNQSGTSLPAAVVRLGGEEPRRGYPFGYLTAGPAADDVPFPDVLNAITGGGAEAWDVPYVMAPPSDEEPATH